MSDEKASKQQAVAKARATEHDGTQAMAEYNAEVLDSRPGIREAFLMMLREVPERTDEAVDVAARIVGTILAAEKPEDVDRPWDSEGMRKYFDQVVIVNAISRRPSDYEGGLGVYLGCECVIERTGEETFVSCGSVSAVAELVRLYALGSLPVKVVPIKAKKATKNGYWPYHLEVVAWTERA